MPEFCRQRSRGFDRHAHLLPAMIFSTPAASSPSPLADVAAFFYYRPAFR